MLGVGRLLARGVAHAHACCAQEGLRSNITRGCGLVFGPDVTEAFLSQNDLKLIIRSHEGPDARIRRPDMGSMDDGWCVDHVTQSGKLATLFSAPDYPQFLADCEARVSNRATFAVLRGPHYDEPEITRFDAAPRPAHHSLLPYYEPGVAGSDEEGPSGGGSDAD